jgi:L-lactate utilization protein LutC
MAGTGSTPGLIEGVRGPLNERFREIPTRERIERTAEALRRNGMTVYVESSAAAALDRFQSIVPEGAEVMTGVSRTVEEIGIAELVNGSGKYRSIRAKLQTMDRKTQSREMIKLGATPEYMVGSVHALTEQGQAVIASATGSQLGPYAAGAEKVVWIVGAQKLVRDLEEAFRRIREYSFGREDERAQKAYGVGTVISKILIVQKERTPGRISVIIVPAELGF